MNEDEPQQPNPSSETNDRGSSLGVDRAAGRPAAGQKGDAAREAAIAMAQLLEDDKCTDILVLDLRGLSEVTDYFVLASGTSERQMRSAGMHIEELGETMDFTLHRHNLKEREANWIVLDFVDIVAHIFEPQTRLYYDLEMLWGDATRIDWRRERGG